VLHYHTFPGRRGRLAALLCLGAISSPAAPVEASVTPRPPRIVLSSSADYPEMVFVVYEIKADDPWATGSRVDQATARTVPAGAELEWPLERAAVLAVPRALAEKKGGPDPAWLGSSAPGVIRFPEAFSPPRVYRRAVLRYQLEKTDKGPKLTLLNPDELSAAQQQYSGDTPAKAPEGQQFVLAQPLFLWGLAAGGGLGLVVGAGFSWRLSRSRLPPARDGLS
jgi:hypothetical protein